MSDFADQMDDYEAGKISGDDLARWVATNINKHDSRLAELDKADRYDEAEREYWRQLIGEEPEPGTTEEVEYLCSTIDDLDVWEKVMFAADPAVDVEMLEAQFGS